MQEGDVYATRRIVSRNSLLEDAVLARHCKNHFRTAVNEPFFCRFHFPDIRIESSNEKDIQPVTTV